MQSMLKAASSSTFSATALRVKVMELFKRLVYNPECEEEYDVIANELKAVVASHATADSADQFRIYFGRYHLKRALWSYVGRINAEHYAQRTSNMGETGHRMFKDALQRKSTCHSAIETFISHVKQQAQRFIDILNKDNRHLPAGGEFAIGRTHATRAARDLVAKELNVLAAYPFVVERRDPVVHGDYHHEIFSVRYQRERMVALVYHLSSLPITETTPMHRFLCLCRKPIQLQLPCRHVLAAVRELFGKAIVPGQLCAAVIQRWHTSFTGKYAVRLFKAMGFGARELATFQYLPPGAPDIVMDTEPAAMDVDERTAADTLTLTQTLPATRPTRRAPKRGRGGAEEKTEENAAKAVRVHATRPSALLPPASPPRAERAQGSSAAVDTAVEDADALHRYREGSCETGMDDFHGRSEDEEPLLTQDALDPPSERAKLNKTVAALRTMFYKLPTGRSRDELLRAILATASSEFEALGGSTLDYPREPGMSQSRRIRSRGEWN